MSIKEKSYIQLTATVLGPKANKPVPQLAQQAVRSISTLSDKLLRLRNKARVCNFIELFVLFCHLISAGQEGDDFIHCPELPGRKAG